MHSVGGRGNGAIHVSPASTEAARRLWAGENVEMAPPDAVVAVIEQVSSRLRLGLGRWIGFEGYGVLLERVLEEAVAEYPALCGLRCLPSGEKKVAGKVPAHEVPAVIRGFVSVVALLIQRLSQVIGEDMAMRLVEQAWTARPSDGSTDETRGASNVQEVRSR
jgi:hypothetical protein